MRSSGTFEDEADVLPIADHQAASSPSPALRETTSAGARPIRVRPETYGVFAAYISEIVLTRAAELEPRQKFHAIGILLTIANEQRKGQIATNQVLSRLVGADEGSMSKVIKNFVRKGVLTKKQMTNRQGRGRVFELLFAETEELRRAFGFLDEAPVEIKTAKRSNMTHPDDSHLLADWYLYGPRNDEIPRLVDHLAQTGMRVDDIEALIERTLREKLTEFQEGLEREG